MKSAMPRKVYREDKTFAAQPGDGSGVSISGETFAEQRKMLERIGVDPDLLKQQDSAAMRETMERMAGHETPRHGLDIPPRPDGWYNGTHAELRLLVDEPNVPVGVTKHPCPENCDPGIQRLAAGVKEDIVVQSPEGPTLYRADGEVDPQSVTEGLQRRQQPLARRPVGRRGCRGRQRHGRRRTVNDEIEQAVAALEAAPDGWLDLPARRRLREALGPSTPPDDGGPDAGLLRRAALLEATVRRALPVWEAAFPDDRRPHEIADALLPALRGERSEEELDDLARALRDDVDRLGGDADRTAPYYVGTAAVRLTTQRLGRRHRPRVHPGRGGRSGHRRAAGRGARRVGAGRATTRTARRDYWRWYVTEAVPRGVRCRRVSSRVRPRVPGRLIGLP